MRRCPYCKVGIEGDLTKCPLCQSKLTGTAEAPCYPEFEAQKKRSFLYKMPLAWAICLMISVILFAGAVIFRGRAVAAELQRRFHL